MRLGNKKRIAAQLLGVSKKRVRLDTESYEDIKEAITKADIRGLIKDKAIIKKHAKGISRSRVKPRRNKLRKGKASARTPGKATWMAGIRLQRGYLKELRDKALLTPATYRNLYRKSKGGFFRSKRHLNLYLDEHRLIAKKR